MILVQYTIISNNKNFSSFSEAEGEADFFGCVWTVVCGGDCQVAVAWRELFILDSECTHQDQYQSQILLRPIRRPQ